MSGHLPQFEREKASSTTWLREVVVVGAAPRPACGPACSFACGSACREVVGAEPRADLRAAFRGPILRPHPPSGAFGFTVSRMGLPEEGNETAGALVWDLLGAEAVLDFSQPGKEKVPIRAELDYQPPFLP